MAKLFHRILCPIDFDENSLVALDLGCKLAVENEARVCLMHVLALPVTSAELGPVPLEPYDVLEKDARAQLERIAHERIPAGVHCEIETSVGTPSHSIVATQAKRGVDLIVMATHGRKRSVIGHFLLGSVAEHVVRESACPVLVVPPR